MCFASLVVFTLLQSALGGAKTLPNVVSDTSFYTLETRDISDGGNGKVLGARVSRGIS